MFSMKTLNELAYTKLIPSLLASLFREHMLMLSRQSGNQGNQLFSTHLEAVGKVKRPASTNPASDPG